ncbi:MAG: hypothetical protein IAF94_16505, partial [Pirellulaceae bacterium]|nr:hypothetical protein [Pirellulaceae bacterium]
VEELAQAAGQEIGEVRTFTRGGATLLEMELHPELRGLLNEKWDYVVLQEHSTLGLSAWNGELSVNDPAYFLQGTRLIAQRAKGARLILFATWARKNHPEFQPYLDYAYTAAARELNAAAVLTTVAPVGRAWAAVREAQPNIELFDPDGTHPGPNGSYVGACVIMRTIFAKPCSGLPLTLRGNPLNVRGQKDETREVELINLKPEVAAVLQREADEATTEPGTLAPWPQSPSVSGRRPKADEIAGRWRGRVFFYGNPAQFELELKPEGENCTAIWRVNADNGAWSFARRSATCRLTEQGLIFTIADPLNSSVEQHNVSWAGKELTAVTTIDFRTAMRRSGGTWTARPDTHTRSSR